MTITEWKINSSMYVFTVAYADTDAGGVVYHSRYLEHCERARGKYFSDIQLSQKSVLSESNIIFVVTKDLIDFHAPVKFEDRVSIETTIKNLSGVRIVFTQEVYVNGHLKVTNEAHLACVDASTFSPKKIPLQLREKLCKSMDGL